MRTLNQIISDIKCVNDLRIRNGVNVISKDQSNEEINNILSKYELEDDADNLESEFGSDGLQKIRDAEQGMY